MIKCIDNESKIVHLPATRVTEKERQEGRAAAKEMGMTVSNYIRYCINLEMQYKSNTNVLQADTNAIEKE